MPDRRILLSEVVDVLRSLKVNRASGSDGISHRMLKNTSKTISVPLTKYSIYRYGYMFIRADGNLHMSCLFLRKVTRQKLATIQACLTDKLCWKNV